MQQINGIAGAAGGAFSGGAAVSEFGGSFGIAVGALLGGAAAGCAGYFGSSSDDLALVGGTIDGSAAGVNTPGSPAVGGSVGGVVTYQLQSSGIPDYVAIPAGGATGGALGGVIAVATARTIPSTAGAVFAAAARAGKLDGLNGLSGGAVTAAVAAALNGVPTFFLPKVTVGIACLHRQRGDRPDRGGVIHAAIAVCGAAQRGRGCVVERTSESKSPLNSAARTWSS